jgi:hypothetical protein
VDSLGRVDSRGRVGNPGRAVSRGRVALRKLQVGLWIDRSLPLKNKRNPRSKWPRASFC